MVARVAAEEPQPRRGPIRRPAHQLWRQPHRVAQHEAQNVPVEVQRLRIVAGGEHHVAQTLLTGDELVPVGADHPAVLECGAMEDLQPVPGGVTEGDHLIDAAVGEFGRGGLLVPHALDVERVPDALQALGVRTLPAGFRQPVVLAGNDDQASREVVHPKVERTLGRASALHHAENLEAVLPPRGNVGRLYAQIAQRPDRAGTARA